MDTVNEMKTFNPADQKFVLMTFDDYEKMVDSGSKLLLSVKEFGKLTGICERRAREIVTDWYNHPRSGYPAVKANGCEKKVVKSSLDKWLENPMNQIIY